MKRKGNLYQDVCDIENIKLAIWNASNRKRKRSDVQRILFNMDYYAYKLQEMLINKEYVPTPPRIKSIYCKTAKKYREIGIPKFYPDLCVQWALMQVIRPELQKGMYYYSCGSVPGKGNEFARKTVEKWIRNDPRNTKYCLTMDISKFYPSVNLGFLKNMLRRKFKDNNLLWLMDTIIDVQDKGLPIGFYTSTWFSNFLLTEMDHKIKEQFGGAVYYIRNVDDMNCYGPNKRKLHKLRVKISEYLKSIGLTLKSNWQVFKYEKNRVSDFVGYCFHRTYTRLRKRISLSIRRRANKIYKRGWATVHEAYSIISSLGWSEHADCYNFYQANIKNKIDINYIKEVIANASRKRSYEIRKLYEAIYCRCSYFCGQDNGNYCLC